MNPCDDNVGYFHNKSVSCTHQLELNKYIHYRLDWQSAASLLLRRSVSSYLVASWSIAWSGGLKEVKSSRGGDTTGHSIGPLYTILLGSVSEKVIRNIIIIV